MKYTNEEREIHAAFMKAILQEIAKKNYPTCLKGGTALFLCHGLERFSEDIDLNSEKKFNLETTIKIAAQKSGINILSINIPKDTNTTKRYKISYNDGRLSNERTLKLETSFRDKINPEDVAIFNGIKAYKVQPMISMKLNAIKSRTKARDFHDIIFLAKNYTSDFSKSQQKAFVELLDNIDKVLSFEEDYSEDYILKDQFNSDIEELEKLLDSIKSISKE